MPEEGLKLLNQELSVLGRQGTEGTTRVVPLQLYSVGLHINVLSALRRQDY